MLQVGGKDAAALDVHYLANGRADGTLIIFDGSGISEPDVPAVLARIDDLLLPDVNMADGNLSFTVVAGHVLGAFVATQQA